MSWYIEAGPESDVIISSRVRLARNLAHQSFPNHLTEAAGAQIAAQIKTAFDQINKSQETPYLEVNLEELSEAERRALAEKHLISNNMIQIGNSHRLMIKPDESIGTMVNEEDHLRIQAMASGFALDEVYQAADQLAQELEEHLPIAYDAEFGFLTACPTNTGTGMRASVMAHLPGLSNIGLLKGLAAGLSKAGFAVRGTDGEGSRSEGELIQISNQLTLGLTEAEILQELKRVVRQLIEQEKAARQKLWEHDKLRFEDQIWRAYGTLRYARQLSEREANELISSLRLGQAMGLLPNLSVEDLNRMQSMVGPACIQKLKGQPLSTRECNRDRAHLLQSVLDKKDKQNKEDL